MAGERLARALDRVAETEDTLKHCLVTNSEVHMLRCAEDALRHAVETKDLLAQAVAERDDIDNVASLGEHEAADVRAALYHISQAIDAGRKAVTAQDMEEFKRELVDFKTRTDYCEAFMMATVGQMEW